MGKNVTEMGKCYSNQTDSKILHANAVALKQ